MDLPVTFDTQKPLKGQPMNLREEIEFALQEDDQVEFLRIVKSPGFEKRRRWFQPRTIFEFDALKCANAVFNGSTRGIIDLKDALMDDISVLHFAASIGRSPKITKYLLECGADADAKCDFLTWKLASVFPSIYVDIDIDNHRQFTHINLILEQVANDFDVQKRTNRKSIYELLLHLCYTLRKSMEVVRLLVQHTQRNERLTQEFINYAHKGKLVHLAALLLAAPELFLTPSLAGVECPFDNLYKHRTFMDEGLSLLLDVFAVVGPKLVAYLRIDFPTMQSGRLPYMEIAFLLREVARKRGVPSPDDYFLRLLKCDEPKSYKECDEVPEKFVDDCPDEVVCDLGPCLQYNDLDQAYINRVLPDLKPDEQVYLNRAMEIKLSSMPIMCRRLHEGITTVSSPILPPSGRIFGSGKRSISTYSTCANHRTYFGKGITIVSSPILPPSGRIFGSGKRSISTYSTCANHRTIFKFTSPYSLGDNVMNLTNPKFISAKLSVIAKHLIKRCLLRI